jgi:regulator of protease activity HflC (stomatin/prohibitin superfamily)
MSPVMLAGVAAGFFLVPAVYSLARLFSVEVEDGEAVLVTRFGKHVETLSTPGWNWILSRPLPWVELRRVSLRRDFRDITDVAVNDARGTTVVVDVWLDFRISDPVKASFEVDDWDKALKNLVSSAVIAILGNRDFQQILCDRTELGAELARAIAKETQRWGLTIELVYIRRVSLLPEVSQQVFETVAARLERAKADIEEDGRQRVALLEAETSRQVAELVARAKVQYPQAIGRALGTLKDAPEVMAAYEELYGLSLLRPGRVVAFQGFEAGELSPSETSLMSLAGGAPAAVAESPPRPRGNGDRHDHG